MNYSVLCTTIIPNDGRTKGSPTGATPSDGCLTLIRDACSWGLTVSLILHSANNLLTDNLDAIFRPARSLQVVTSIGDTGIASSDNLFWIVLVPSKLARKAW